MNHRRAVFVVLFVLLSLGASASESNCSVDKNENPLNVKQGETLLYKNFDMVWNSEISVRLESVKKNKFIKIRDGVSTQKDNYLSAIVPFAISDKPGKYFLKIIARDSGRCLLQKTVIVEKKRFPVYICRSWCGKSASLPKAIVKEKEKINDSYLASSEKELWSNGFHLPVIVLEEDKKWLSDLNLPVKEINKVGVVTHPFGEIRKGRSRRSGQSVHLGTDIWAPKGFPIRAIGDGIVVLAGNYTLEGGLVIISHGKNVFSLYLHQSEIFAKKGDVVSRGQTIGSIGETGRTSGEHLDIRVRINGVFVDPIQFVEVLKTTMVYNKIFFQEKTLPTQTGPPTQTGNPDD